MIPDVYWFGWVAAMSVMFKYSIVWEYGRRR